MKSSANRFAVDLSLAAMLLFLVNPAYNQQIKLNLQEINQQAEIILQVKAESMVSRWVFSEGNKNIVTATTFRILDCIKGDYVKNELLTLELPGGQVGDITQYVTSSVGFVQGEEAILFLPKNRTRLIGGFQGKISVSDDIVFIENQKVNSNLFIETLKKAKTDNEVIPSFLKSIRKESFQPAPLNLKGGKSENLTNDTYAITGTIVGFTGTIDNDSDGYFSSFSFSIRVNGDADPGPATVYFKFICTTTGQSFVSNNSYVITGNAVDNYDFGFDQSDFTGLITDNVQLAFSVELLDETRNTVLASDATVDGDAVKVDVASASSLNISSISPEQASAGTNSAITITGTGFGATQGAGKVEFFYRSGEPRITGTISSWSDTQIVCTVPVGIINSYSASAGSGPLTVVNGSGQTSNEFNFKVTFSYGLKKWSGHSLSYRINENLGSIEGEGQAIQNAATTWNSAGGNFQYNFAGTHTNINPTSNSFNDIAWGPLSDNTTIGEASIWSSGTTIVECDITFNSNLSWNAGSNSHDIQTIALHELGHWLNLRDIYGNINDGVYDTGKVMYGFSSLGDVKRSLSNYDADGLVWIYGVVSTVTISGFVKTSANTPVQGVTLSGLTGSPQTNSSGFYTADVSSGFTGTVTPTKSGYTFSPATRSYTSQAANATNQDYTATASVSNDATLSDLKVNGTTVTGFSAATLTYNVALPAGTVTVPTVTATTTHVSATKVITPAASLPGTTNVVVTAQDGTTTKTYSISFTVIKSTDANLSDLKVSGNTVAGFSPSVLSYNVVLPFGTVTVPTVTATTAQAGATKTITPAASLPGATTVRVVAEDGTTVKTYTINFTVLAGSSDATLSDLQVSGTTVTGFSASVTTYNVVLPIGTVTVPTVTATTTHASATKVITPAASLPGTTTVVVTAQDGTTTKTYSVNFTVTAASTDATLSDLKVNGSQVSGFSSTVTGYNVVLPIGTVTVPTVTATTTHVSATKVITPAASLPGTTSVLVTAQDGTTTKTYTISFTVAKSTVATLSDLRVNGTTVSGFNSSVTSYSVALPFGTTVVPAVTATTTDVNATKVITPAASLPGSTMVVVTAEDGSTTKTYFVSFTVSSGATDATLSDLKVNGSQVSGFSSAVTGYNVVLPFGTSTVPTVTATTTDVNATKVITPAASLPGSTMVLVTAEDGSTTKTYFISFTVAKNTDATLSDIKINETTIPGFNKNTLNYTVALPHGSTEPPVITVTVSDPNALTEITLPTGFPGIATIKVTAEDRSTIINYLLAISYGGDGIDDKLLQNNLHVYPNPSNGDFILEYRALNSGRISLLIMDITGRQIYNRQYETQGFLLSELIQISEQPKGLYFIRLVDGSNVVYQKIIVE
jgi:hypothetical protein